MQLAKFQNEFIEYKIDSYVLLISLYHYKKNFLVQHTDIGTKILINNIMIMYEFIYSMHKKFSNKIKRVPRHFLKICHSSITHFMMRGKKKLQLTKCKLGKAPE